MGCGSIEELIIPQYLESIGENAFSYCHGISSIRVESGNKKYYADGNCLIEKIESDNYLVLGCKTSIIPDGIESIVYGAFFGHLYDFCVHSSYKPLFRLLLQRRRRT